MINTGMEERAADDSECSSPGSERGVEKQAELDGLSSADVEKKFAELIGRGGAA